MSLCHYPLNNDLTNRTEVTATLRRLGIPLTLFGHYHRAPSLFNFDSIAGIQGRTLRGKSDSDAGYTLLDFWGDSVRVREKTLGAEPRTRFTIRMQDDLQTLALASDPTPPVPDYKAHARLCCRTAPQSTPERPFTRTWCITARRRASLRAYDTRRNREVWRQRFGGALYTTPLVAEGLVIAGTTTDGLRAYDARTGRERWHIDTPTPIVGQGLVAGRGPNAVLYIGLGNGTMAKIAVSDGRILWRYDYGRGQSQGQPALADGKLVFGPGTGISTASTPRRENSAGSGPTARKASSCPRATSFPGSPEAACSSTRPTAPSPASTSPREASYGAAPTTRPAKHRA